MNKINIFPFKYINFHIAIQKIPTTYFKKIKKYFISGIYTKNFNTPALICHKYSVYLSP